MPDLSRILKASQPLTLAQVARGAQPMVMADLARASTGRAVFIAPDDAAMRAITDAANFRHGIRFPMTAQVRPCLSVQNASLRCTASRPAKPRRSWS